MSTFSPFRKKKTQFVPRPNEKQSNSEKNEDYRNRHLIPDYFPCKIKFPPK